MKYVYILRSQKYPEQTYVGITDNLDERLKQHNYGQCTHSNKYKPWVIENFTAFMEHDKAIQFEKYLKSGSGRAFRKRHF